MKKIFSLFLAVACCSMAIGQIISVTDGTLSDWDNVPSDYLFKTECAPNASKNGLKSVQVYVDLSCINLLVEVNDEVITDREWTPFHVFINSDNSSSTGGYGDLWKDADTDLMLETAIFASGAVYPYNPGVFKWWGPDGGNGWYWTDPEVEITPENGWGALVPEGSKSIGNSQMVDGKIEIQLDYTQIPMPFDETTFTLGFEIQQSWNTVGVLPNADNYELAEKLRVNVHQQNKSRYVTINDIQYKITSNIEPYTAEVFSLFNKDVNITEITIPETIVVDGITYTVTSIGERAFYGCTSLTSITIPNSVTSIGDYAFFGCHSLISVAIGNSVTSIGDYAFCNCFSLASLTIPNSVTSIGNSAFADCFSLTSITIPNSVMSIGESAFSGCSSLASITIPNRVTSIGNRAFEACYSLTSITIPSSVTSIGDIAFADCEGLTSVTISNGVKSIGFGAFSWCISLTSITIPSSVTSIGYEAFLFCSSLTSIVVEAGNTTYDSRDNCNAIIETATNTLIAGCKNTIIPNGVTSIGEGAFGGCIDLTAVIIPESVTSIGDDAFAICEGLTSVTIPNSVTSIGASAFSYCESLTSVTIGNGVKSIGEYAFAWCSNLITVVCHAAIVPSIDENVFYEVPTSSAVLYVPAELIDDYKAADQWKEFGTILPLEEAPSAVDNVEASTRGIQKLLRNGQLVIIRDGVEYTIMGAENK